MILYYVEISDNRRRLMLSGLELELPLRTESSVSQERLAIFISVSFCLVRVVIK